MASEKSLITEKPRIMKVVKLVPPDGGWGWMVLIGTALSNIFNQSMLSLFSLLYGEALEAMGHNTKGAAIVMSTMLFVTNFGGPIAGAIVKLTSTRFVAVIGACFCTAGIFFSGFATNIIHLILSYGLLLGIGLGFIQNSSFVAINSYFKLKKSRAVGLANVGTGVGQTLMPHLVRYLLENYGYRGACLLLSGLSLHGICGTLLIQPVEWHMKKVEEFVVIDEKQQLLEKHKDIVIRKDSNTYKDMNINRRGTEPELGNNTFKNEWNKKSFSSNIELNTNKTEKAANGVNGTSRFAVPPPPPPTTTLQKLIKLFDLSLLKSPRFLNVIFGTAIATTSVQNFSMLFPLFLKNTASFDRNQVAFCMSAVAAADIVGRLVLPYLQDQYRIKARLMFLMTCVWLIVVRQILAYQSQLSALIIMSCLYGLGRSMIIVARNLSISEICRLDQVPAAVGLGMLSMGIIVPPSGYFLGWIRDFTGSYIICITAQNFLLVILLVTWIPDMLLQWNQDRRTQQKERMDMELTEKTIGT